MDIRNLPETLLVLDHLAGRLLRQNRATFDRDVSGTPSSLRTKCGDRSPTGHLIPDELYSPELEDMGIDQICDRLNVTLDANTMAVLEYLESIYVEVDPVHWLDELVSLRKELIAEGDRFWLPV
jgi:hypothetical protein